MLRKLCRLFLGELGGEREEEVDEREAAAVGRMKEQGFLEFIVCNI